MGDRFLDDAIRSFLATLTKKKTKGFLVWICGFRDGVLELCALTILCEKFANEVDDAAYAGHAGASGHGWTGQTRTDDKYNRRFLIADCGEPIEKRFAIIKIECVRHRYAPLIVIVRQMRPAYLITVPVRDKVHMPLLEA